MVSRAISVSYGFNVNGNFGQGLNGTQKYSEVQP